MTTRMIPFGYGVPAGDRVEVPLKHLAICGQTQEAGKTTALDALITRANVRALTFITKRGEAAFAGGRRIGPYFREQADWQFVASLLEASRGEKLKFERAWIIRASKGAKTLADVQRNVRKAMLTARGLSGDVYLTLDAYLDVVVPQIAAVRWAPLDLAPGVNVMDLTGITIELQHLVIKSSLDWVLQHERDTVIVIPEAWKFIPEGRGTPVKLAAESYIRQGAASGNFLWLDSQDLGGIAKVILRSVPVWILGVQRELNEIKRTLGNIPANISKPSTADVAMLELGQFYVCWGRHAIRTYAQPSWLHDDEAQAVATGVLSIDDARKIERRGTVDARSVETWAAESEALRQRIIELQRDNEQLRAQVAAFQARAGSRDRESLPSDRGPAEGAPRTGTPPDEAAGWSRDAETFYQSIKERLIEELPAEPSLMALLVSRPELRVRVERPVITVEGDTLRGRLAQLLAGGFFDEAQTTSTALQELARRGFSTAAPNVAKDLTELARLGFLTRDNKWYRGVPDMRVNIVEA